MKFQETFLKRMHYNVCISVVISSIDSLLLKHLNCSETALYLYVCNVQWGVIKS